MKTGNIIIIYDKYYHIHPLLISSLYNDNIPMIWRRKIMKKTILIVAAIVILAGAGAVAYAVLRTPAEAKQPISAVPLGTKSPAGSSAYPAGATQSVPTTTAGDTLLFQIVPEKSSVRFIINEVLGGSPNTVVGETNQVAGQIEVNLTDPSASRVGVIQVDARTLKTDNDFRNRAIKNQILQTDTYEFVTFTPTSLSGMPASVAVGDTFTFQVSGDLTIRNVTKRVIFYVEVTAVSETSLTGRATASVQRADYGLVIPNVPNVAGVDETVKLEIDFTAMR
jgi:polyisoprenoid-binding protein YceI